MKNFFDTYWKIIASALLLSLSRLPYHLGFLVFFAFIPFLKFFDEDIESFKNLLISALIFAFIQIAVVFYWIGSVTWVGLIGIWLFYSLIYLVLFFILCRIWSCLPILRYIAFVALFIAFEYLQNFGETRFPWWNLGYALADYRLLLQVLDLGGLSLLAFMILTVNYLLYRFNEQVYISFFLILSIFGFWVYYGYYTMNNLELKEADARVAVMQPSIPQEDKWVEDNYNTILARYDSLAAEAKLDGTKLLIFPEAAIPHYLRHDAARGQELKNLMKKYDISIFTGFPHAEAAPAGNLQEVLYYNAASLCEPSGISHPLYFKNILVPVGERMLWLDYFPFLWNLQFGQANWEFGTQVPRYHFGEYEFSPSICYELAFPHFLQGANLALDDGEEKKADFHVNITNDAWFGTSYGPWLHGVMTRFRAIESRIQIYRSANTGISMIVDPMGNTLAQAELFSIENIYAPLYRCERIPKYYKIQNYPRIFVFISMALAVLSLFTLWRRA
ncbi:MAG: apolipoprotein N-acyltransferase [Candidatus Cloacimonetes bacterium]|nr:apolipoprotein N-acyltransferase [Candidatus Cloacimonadota bacterium]